MVKPKKEADANNFVGYQADNEITPLYIEVSLLIGYFNVLKKNIT